MAVKSDTGVFRLCFLALAAAAMACSTDQTTESPKPDAINGVDSNVAEVAVDTATVDVATDSGVDSTVSVDTAAADTAVADTTPEVTDVGCPETPHDVICPDFDLTTGKLDPTTWIVTFALKPSIADIVSGTATIRIVHVTAAATFKDLPLTVTGNTFTLDLSSIFADATVRYAYVDQVVVVDRCGHASTPTRSTTSTQFNMHVERPDDGGVTALSYYCGS